MGITNVDRDDDGLAEAARRHRRRQAAERLAERGARGGFEPTREARRKAERELRAALVTVAPDAVAGFDAERAVALKQARDTHGAAPLRRFIGQWAVYVAIERHPDRAARLRELEARAAMTTSPDDARAIASEVGRILDIAAAEAGTDL